MPYVIGVCQFGILRVGPADFNARLCQEFHSVLIAVGGIAYNTTDASLNQEFGTDGTWICRDVHGWFWCIEDSTLRFQSVLFEIEWQVEQSVLFGMNGVVYLELCARGDLLHITETNLCIGAILKFTTRAVIARTDYQII